MTVTRPGDWFSVRLRDSDVGFMVEYVNIERAHARTPIGFDTDDLCLDIVVSQTGEREPRWELKDEADLYERAAEGIYSEEDITLIRSAADTAIERLNARRAPFDDSWRHFRPDTAWRVPTRLPAVWSTPG